MRTLIDNYISSSYKNYKLLIAELGNFPLINNQNNLINTGLSESLMIDLAIGLNKENIESFIYSVAGFTYLRALEQLKYLNYKITLFNAGAGFCYYDSNPSHHLIDDFAILSTLNNIMLFSPLDRGELKKCINKKFNSGLKYIRLGYDDYPEIKEDIAYCKYTKITNSKKPIIITLGSLSNFHYRYNKDNYYIFHVPHINKLSYYQNYLLSLKNKIIIIEDHIKQYGLSYYIPKVKLYKHYYLPKSVTYTHSSREDYLKEYNLIF
jgi:deoxyxylulose-5-phosphate synthase